MKYLPWRLTILGSLRADTHCGTASITKFRSQKTASLIAYLASHPERKHPREELVERFWPENGEAAGRNSLRVALTTLRRELEPSSAAGVTVLETDRLTVGFVPGTIECDVVAFDAALRRANRAGRDDGEIRAEALTEAVTLYAGPLLPGFYDDWVCEERERLQAAFSDALERLAEYHEARNDPRTALEYAQRLAVEQGADLADPSDPLSLRIARLRRLAAEDEVTSAQDASEAAARPFLPRPLDAFIGRDELLQNLKELILCSSATARAVTLTGPGGTGKTRLALETAALLGREFGANNVCFVPLVEVNEPGQIYEAIRDALRLPHLTWGTLSETEAQDALLNQILQSINEKQDTDTTPIPFLLVLDNFEQLTERHGAAAAEKVGRILQKAARLLSLITSRRRIGISGERLFAVPPLAVPAASSQKRLPAALAQVPSVALFLERACSVNPDFRLTEENAATVAELCARLEGLPLAIELAAAWSGSLSPKTMLARITERFALLASVRGQDKTHRHRSLWATIAWSFDLLPPDLQQFWVQLSVFRGGWTAESAAALNGMHKHSEKTAGVHEFLARLRERSLIVASGEDANGELRFTLLESLREWAAQQMDSEASIRTRTLHGSYFRQMTEAARGQMRGPAEKFWLDRFEDDHDNLRAACDFYYAQAHCEESFARDGLTLVGALSLFWRKRGYLLEARQRTEKFLALPFAKAVTLERGKALNSIGLTAWMQNDLIAAKAFYEEGLSLFQTLEDSIGIGKVLSNLSLIAMEGNDYPQVIALSEESLALHRSTKDRLSEAICLGNLGNVYLETDDYAKGKLYHNEALEIYRDLGDNEGITIALSGLAYAAVHLGDRKEARRLFHEALVIRHGLNDLWRICFSLTSIADFLMAEGSVSVSAQLYGAADALREEIGAPFSEVRQAEFDGKCAEMAKIIGHKTFDAAYKMGRRLGREEAVGLALKCCLSESG